MNAPSDAARAEWFARRLDPELWAGLDRSVRMQFVSLTARDASLRRARDAIRVADEERAGAPGWAEYEAARDALESDVTAWAHDQSGPDEKAEKLRSRATLDALVRRLMP